MAVINDQTQLTGLFKDVYGPTVITAFDFMAILSQMIGFEYQESGIGGTYKQPVDLTMEHGFSTSAAGVTPSTTNNTYVDPIAGEMQEAQATGSKLDGHSQVSYEALYRAAQAGKQAFEAASKRVVKRLGMAGLKRFEIALLHGRSGLGQIASVGAVTGAGPYTVAATLTAASWSAFIWAGAKNAQCDFYTTAGAQRNGTAAAGQCTITAVDPATRTITFQSSTNGTTAGTDGVGTIQATNNIFWRTASPTNEIAGIDAWSQLNSATGTWFNISSTYDLWQANQYSASTGLPAMAKLLEAASMAVPYGLPVKRMVALVSPTAFEVLNPDEAALRRYNDNPSKAIRGVRAIEYNGQNTQIDVVAHPAQKDGLIHLFAPDEAVRVGATELTFIQRHGSEEKLILESATSPASEMRVHCNQQLFFGQPRHIVRMAGVTY